MFMKQEENKNIFFGFANVTNTVTFFKKNWCWSPLKQKKEGLDEWLFEHDRFDFDGWLDFLSNVCFVSEEK